MFAQPVAARAIGATVGIAPAGKWWQAIRRAIAVVLVAFGGICATSVPALATATTSVMAQGQASGTGFPFVSQNDGVPASEVSFGETPPLAGIIEAYAYADYGTLKARGEAWGPLGLVVFGLARSRSIGRPANRRTARRGSA